MRRDTAAEATVREKFTELSGFLDERVRRLWAATEAKAVGFGGDALVSAATGIARQTIRKGRRELEAGIDPSAPLRRPGAGRKRLEQEQPGLKEALDALVEPATRGDPMSPLRWTSKSAAKLTAELREQGRIASISWVGRMLRRMGYSQRALRKTREGESHPDRNAQFEHINATAKDFLERGQPVISVDTKKKELVGDFKNGGREWQHKHEPEKVLVHDFPTDALGKAIPYGIYDLQWRARRCCRVVGFHRRGRPGRPARGGHRGGVVGHVP